MNERTFICFITLFFVHGSSLVSGDEKPKNRIFRAGASAVDITPKLGVLLDGPISKPGPVLGVHDRLHARALMLDDGTTRLAIVICDACMIGRDVYDEAKAIVHKETSLAKDRMLMAATHTHAAVRAVHIGTGPLDQEYHDFLARQIAAAVIQAKKNLAPARVGWGSFDKPQFVRCRRSLCQPGFVGSNPFGATGERVASVAMRPVAVLKPAGPVDPQVSILSIQHADGKPLAVLANYSVHYCGGYGRGLVSADYFGYVARALELRLDASDDHPPFVGIMSNGTSGDTGSIATGGKKYPVFEWMQVSARILAEDAVRVVRKIEHRTDVTLDMRESDQELTVRRPDEKRLAWANEILTNPKENQPHRWTTIYARESLHLAKYPARKSLKLQAIRIGDLSIAAIPCEVFAETGLAIKKQSPHKATFTIELANGYGGYLPTPKQHEWGGYETWPARSSHLEIQAEPKIRAETLRLLKEVRNEGNHSISSVAGKQRTKSTRKLDRQPRLNTSVPGVEISEEVSPIRKLKITAEDGNQIEVVIRTPPGDGPFPAVIVLHGGMSHRPVESRVRQSRNGPLCTRLLAYGYAVVVSTYRSYEDRSRDPGPILDNVAVIEHLGNMPKIDGRSIVVLGNSGGGRLALELAGLGRRPRLAAIVCGEPATTLYAEMYPPGMRGPNMKVSRNREKYFTEKNQAILEKKVEKLAVPILLVHSDVHHVNKLNNAALVPEIKRQGKELEIKVYPGYGHGLIWGRDGNLTVKVYDRLVDDIKTFLTQHIKTRPKPIGGDRSRKDIL